MRLIKIKNADNKTGDTGNDYLISLYKDDDTEPLSLDNDISCEIKIGNDTGYLKTIDGKINDDNNGLTLFAKDLSDLPEGLYYIEIWFNKDGLNYIYPSNGKATIKLEGNIETVKGNVLPALTVDAIRQEIASTATKGPKGDTGETGKDGESAYQIWLDNGNKGTENDFLNSLKGSTGKNGTDGKSAYDTWLANGNEGTEEDFLNSLKGPKGDTGSQGIKGDTGNVGATGKDGKSAYQVWIDAGNKGTETDFLNSLKGKDGATGATGQAGTNGKSAYDIWLELGNKGSEQDFINSLKGDNNVPGVKGDTGADGKSAYQIWLDLGNTGSEHDFINSLKGADGTQGAKGDKGDPGQPGEKGDKGDPGQTGQDGKSAYQLWLDQGNSGSETDFLNSLKGKDVDPQTVTDLTDKITANTNSIKRVDDNVTALQSANFVTKDTMDDAIKKSAASSTTTRHAPTGYTLDRTTTPCWTIWFDNGSGIQFPEYGTMATIYGYGFGRVDDYYSNTMTSYPLIPNVMSAAHGTLTTDKVAQLTEMADFWADSTKVINPINTDADSYDWSDVFFNDTSRSKKGDYREDRQKVFLRVLYQLGIWSVDDIKPFGLKEK